MKVLLTCFESFGSFQENSSWITANEVYKTWEEDFELFVVKLPVSYNRAFDNFCDVLNSVNPNIVLMLGQTSQSNQIKLEQSASNLMRARSADNDGVVFNEKIISEKSPSTLNTRVILEEINNVLTSEGISSQISNSCGFFVCNRLYFDVLAFFAQKTTPLVLFVHLPLCKSQTESYGLPLEEMVKSVKIIIEELVNQYELIHE